MQETQVRSLGQEDPLEEGTGTHSSRLAWRIPWTEEPGELQSMRLPRGMTERLISNNEIPALTPVTDGNRVMGFPPPPLKSCVRACAHVCVRAQVCVRHVCM